MVNTLKDIQEPERVVQQPQKEVVTEVSAVDVPGAIQEDARIAVYVNKLNSTKPAVEKIVADALIEEDRVIDKQEALKYLLLAAQADGVDLEGVVLTEVYTDSNGAVIKLETKSTDEKTGNYKLFTYQIKRAKKVDETNVDVADFDKDADWPNSGDVLAKYVKGQWTVVKR